MAPRTSNFNGHNIMKSETIIYFAYGANLNKHGMDNRCLGNKPLCRAILKNYRLVFKNVADIEEATNHYVQGALYEINRDHLVSLDRFEGYPRLYTRTIVPVFTEHGKEIYAVVYKMTTRNQYSRPHQGYLNIIISGCRQWQLPEEYIQYIITRANEPNFGET
ncbi:MAG: gamma-glutamylcyclotransferase [Calditrichaeota bacterium]|nr:gamma-glutamylcyclotransferase [Calditrichota bacterium]